MSHHIGFKSSSGELIARHKRWRFGRLEIWWTPLSLRARKILKQYGANPPLSPIRFRFLSKEDVKGLKSMFGKFGVFTILCLFIFSCKNQVNGNCYPVSAPTGTIKCYSGGSLIYSANTYRNGGVLCKTDGKEIKYDKNFTGVFCVEESWQDRVWNPPAPSLSAER